MSKKVLESAKRALEECRPQDAIIALEPLVEYDDEDVDALVYLGMAYVQAEMPEKAVEVLYRADALVEQHFVIELFLGRALWALGKVVLAEEHLKEALHLDSTEPEPWIDLGRIYLQRQDYLQALKHIEAAHSHFPSDLNLSFLYALVLYRLGDLTAATEEWARIHKVEPELMTCVSNYAFVLLLQGRSFEAAPFVGYANTMNPDDYRAQILLGELRFQSGDHEGAIESFGKVLDKDPINIEALSRLAIIAHNSRDERACNEYLNRAEMEVGNDLDSWRALSEAYHHIGRQEEHSDCLIRWIRADPKAVAPWLILAKEYDKQGQREHARKAWRTIFELRGYVKIQCPTCKIEIRHPFDSLLGFDIYSDTICNECENIIYMPSGLPFD